jgi:hypothetical protein
LSGWPTGMRIIARRERPHPGAQLRLTDADGWRITCFATNTPRWQLADLELRHSQRARAEDRIRNLKDTGVRNLLFCRFAQNQIWLEIIALAADLLVWTQTLAFTNHPGPTLGTQTAAAPTAWRRRANHTHRPAPPASTARRSRAGQARRAPGL